VGSGGGMAVTLVAFLALFDLVDGSEPMLSIAQILIIPLAIHYHSSILIY
jgi:hypothetical protein